MPGKGISVTEIQMRRHSTALTVPLEDRFRGDGSSGRREFSSRLSSTAPWIPILKSSRPPCRLDVGSRPGFHFGEDGRLS